MLACNEFYLTLIRHGQSTTNQNPDLMGQTATVPLSENGVRQAKLLGKRLLKEVQETPELGYDYVWSSNYTRALDTANIALNGIAHTGIKIASELREYDAGDWLGKSRSETLTMSVLAKMAANGHGFLPPEGESLHQVQRRASLWLEENILYNKGIIEESQARKENDDPPPTILVFSHGMTIKCLLHYVMGFDQSFTWKIILENTSLTKLYYGDKGWKLLGINDHAHLSLL